MKTTPDTDDWKKKYYDSLDKLESEQAQFRAVESVLKRLAGRLCITSLGQSPRLDSEIKKLQTAIRRDIGNDELEKISTALTDAINALDQPVASTTTITTSTLADPSHEVIASDEQLRSVLSALLVELRRDPELLIQADVLDGKLSRSMTREQLPEVMSSLTEMVGQRIQRIERAKHEVEILLSQMVGKLDEINRFVADQYQSQSQSQASSDTLNTRLVGEMKAMGESVDEAVDLTQIRQQVRSRIDSIGHHLQEFRQREVTLANTMRARSEQMQARVTELEAEAGRLHNQLKDEQRIATLDVLTQVPNRLAFEKRMDEELKRLQRFKQPVCLAVWDVDHFKRVNDTFGHLAGDRVLRTVADSLSARLRSTDFIARYGGEEFVMLLCGTDLDNAVRLIDEMRMGIAQLKLHFRGTPLVVTISSGVTAVLPTDLQGAAFERADKALYAAKEAGRNRCMTG